MGICWARTWWLGCLVLIATTAISATAAAAAPGWQSPVTISSGSYADCPQLSTDGNGGVTAVWQSEDHDQPMQLQAADASAGSWPNPVVLTATESQFESLSCPALAEDAHGDAVVTWQKFESFSPHTTTTFAATRTAGGPWQPPVDIATVDDDSALPPPSRVAIDARGDATAVWVGADASGQIIRAATKPAGGAWQPQADVSAAAPGFTDLQLAVAPDGRAVVVWSEESGQVFAAVRPAGGSWQAPVDIDDGDTGTRFGAEPRIAIDGQDVATVVWQSYSGGSDGVLAVYASSLAPGGAWQPPVLLSSLSAATMNPSVASDARGDVTASWALGDDTSYVMQAASRPAGGQWGVPVTLSGASVGPVFDTAGLAVNPAGVVFAVWGLDDFDVTLIQSDVRTAAGAWQPPVQLATDPIATSPAVVADPYGNAATAFTTETGDAITVEAAGDALSGPVLTGLSVPASATVGAPVSFSVTPRDAWSPVVVTHWDFGDGQAAVDQTVSHTFTTPGVYTVRVSGTDGLGNTSTATGQITITAARATTAPAPAPAPVPAPAPAPEPTPRITTSRAPALRAVSETHRRWRESGVDARPRAGSRRLPVGTTISYTIDQPARVSLRFRRLIHGHSLHGRCVTTPPSARSHRPRCTRTRLQATVSSSQPAGRHRLRLTGRIGGRSLPPGSYRLLITARNRDGQQSRVSVLHFVIG